MANLGLRCAWEAARQLAPVAPVGSPARPPTPTPRAAKPEPRKPLAFQVQDLRVHSLPDGSEDLWVHAPGHRPARVGQVGDPKIAEVVELYRRHQAEIAPSPKHGTARARADAAKAALSALAEGLPELASLGLDVTITITTRPRS